MHHSSGFLAIIAGLQVFQLTDHMDEHSSIGNLNNLFPFCIRNHWNSLPQRTNQAEIRMSVLTLLTLFTIRTKSHQNRTVQLL